MINPLSYFLNERMLFGTLAAGAPILIHLFHRAKYDVRGWGAMMFLQESVDAKARSIKINQWILLALRCLFFFLLALTMARPITNPGAMSQSRDDQVVTHVLIIDTSCSTRYGNSEERVFDLIQESALAITRDIKPNDTMLIIRAGSKAVPMFRSPVSDKEFLLRKIRGIPAGYGKATLVDAVMQAFHLLDECKTSSQRIYVLTDDQAISWPSSGSLQWQEYQRVYDLLKVKPYIYVIPHRLDVEIPNIQILRITQDFPIVDIYRRNRFTVDIRNDGVAKRVRIDFFSGDQLESEREIELQSGINSISFDCSFSKPGAHYVRARIPGDCLSPDNTYTLALNVVKQIPVLLIEGNSSPDPLVSDGGCMSMALSPVGAQAEDSLISVTTRNQTALDTIDAAYLNNFKSIILANVSSFSTRFRSRLERFVQQGGGVFICLGPDVDSGSYNILYKDDGGFLPCLLKNQTPLQKPPSVPVFHRGASTIILSNITMSDHAMMESIRINQFHLATAAADTQVLASCNEFPLLMKKTVGKGQVVMWTSTGNSEWTNFPFTEDFLPLIQNIVVYLSSNIRPPINLNLNESLFFSANVTQKNLRTYSHSRSALLTRPNLEKSIIPINYDDGQWLGRFESTMMPGLYSIKFGEQPPHYYSVNLDVDEGHLTVMSKDEQRQLAQRLDARFLSGIDRLSAMTSKENNPGEIWQWFLMLALGLLALELTLGWVFR